MKVYFSASTERTEKSKELYREIINILDSLDMENSNPYLTAIVEEKSRSPLPKDLYEVALRSVSNSDLLIVDISEQSLSVGILIEFALNNSIPVLCICEEIYQMNIPRILTHRKQSTLLTLLVFNNENINEKLNRYFESFKKNKIKFNVFISPEIDSYMK